MKFTKEIVDNLAENLLIGLNESENQMVLEELKEIEQKMEMLKEIPGLEKTIPMTHPFPLENVLLEDSEQLEELTTEEVLKNAFHKSSVAVIVPKVVE